MFCVSIRYIIAINTLYLANFKLAEILVFTRFFELFKFAYNYIIMKLSISIISI